MKLKSVFSIVATTLIFALAILLATLLWRYYMDSPWTRDARVRADIVQVAPDVSGAVVKLAVRDNQYVRRGDLLAQIDPARYQLALDQSQASVAAKQAELTMRRQNAARRADVDNLVVSSESRDNANSAAAAALAEYQQAVAQLAIAKLNLTRTRMLAPVDGYVTNLNLRQGDYATAGVAKLAVVDSHSFWVYGYFEETKLPYLKVGDPAEILLMSGPVLRGHVDSISRGISDRDNPSSRELLADINPTFNWVRLAQRVPVRISIDQVPDGVLLAAGITCTVVVKPASSASGSAKPAKTS